MSYEIILADTLTMNNIGPLAVASGKTLSAGLNKAGSCGFSYPITEEYASEILPVSRCIKVELDGTEVWSGPIWTTEDVLPDKKINVGCVGWFEFLNKRITKANIVKSGVDAGQIAIDLLAATHADHPIPIIAGTVEPSISLKYNPLPKYTNIGNHISSMADIENGPDFEITPDTRQLNIYARKGVVLPEVIFDYNWKLNNLSGITVQVDGSQIMNDMIATAQTGVAPGAQSDPASIAAYGAFQEHAALPYVNNSGGGTPATVYYAAAEVAVRSKPRVTLNISPRADAEGAVSFHPFIDFNPGDTITMGVVFGRLGIKNQKMRVFDFTVDMDKKKITQIKGTYSS